MATKFKTLLNKMSAKDRAEIKARARILRSEMTLHQLREALELTQDQLAKRLNVKQAHISKLERSTDVYMSTLKRFVHGIGGELEVTARLADGSKVKINQFSKRIRKRA